MDSRAAKLLQRCNHEPDRSDQLLENSGAKIRIQISRQNILRSVWDLQVSKNLFQNIFQRSCSNIEWKSFNNTNLNRDWIVTWNEMECYTTHIWGWGKIFLCCILLLPPFSFFSVCLSFFYFIPGLVG